MNESFYRFKKRKNKVISSRIRKSIKNLLFGNFKYCEQKNTGQLKFLVGIDQNLNQVDLNKN